MKKLFFGATILLLMALVSCGTNIDPEDLEPDVAVSKLYGPLIGVESGGAVVEGGMIDLLDPDLGPLTVPAAELADPLTNQMTANPLSVFVTASDELEVAEVELFYNDASVGVWNKATDGISFNNPFIFPKPGSGQTTVAIEGSSSGLLEAKLHAVATDSSGQTTESAPVELRIDGSLPDIDVSVQGDGTAGPITVTARAADPETGIRSFSANPPLAQASSTTFSEVLTPEAGPHTYTFSAINGAGAFNEREVSFSVTEPVEGSENTPPTVSLTANPSFGDAPLQVIFTATAQDEDGDELSYTWDFGNGAGASSGNTQTTTYSANGTYTATVSVDDGNGGTAEANTTVIVGDGVDPTDSTDPTDPTDPTDATDPTDPTDPTDSTDPTDTTDPTDPTELPTIESFTASAGTAEEPVTPNTDVTLAWNVTGVVTEVTITPESGEAVDVTTDEDKQLTVNPAVTTTYSLTASNDAGETTQTVTVTVEDDNGGVNAVDDAATTTAGQAATIEVLANDEPGEAELIIIIVTSPSEGGTVAISRDSKTILYTPKEGFTGEETFSYTVRDEDNNRSTAQVTVQVE